MKQKNKVLVVAAHPDDEILGCGATIAKHIANGDVVQVLILGAGIAARKNITIGQRKKLLENLHQCAIKANGVIGVKNLTLKDFPDNKFDSVPLLDIIHSIEEVADVFKPNIIYTHHRADVNIDHRKIAEAIQSVVRPMQGSVIKRVLAFEVASSTEWNFCQTPRFVPNVFINISDFFDKKIKAMQCYEGELRKFPHPRSLEYLDALVKVRGGQSGMLAAEAFELIYLREE